LGASVNVVDPSERDWFFRRFFKHAGRFARGAALCLPIDPSCTTIMRHTLSALVENKFGVLARVAGMFSGRGYNIDSLNVAPTHDASLSRITTIVRGDDETVDQITKQLRKLVNVVDVIDYSSGQAVERELILVKVKADSQTRSEILQICDIFRAKIINVALDNVIIEITGDCGKTTAFLELLGKFGIIDLARTGKLALSR
jgi:acetolactate synthase-1/3 small subunit